MDHTSIDIYLVIDTFLLLLIGIGPKIALVPFLEVTAAMDGATKALSSARCSSRPASLRSSSSAWASYWQGCSISRRDRSRLPAASSL
jgi:hypothetical protein